MDSRFSGGKASRGGRCWCSACEPAEKPGFSNDNSLMHGLQPDLGHALALWIDRDECPDGVLAQCLAYGLQMYACTDARVILDGSHINAFWKTAVIDDHLW